MAEPDSLFGKPIPVSPSDRARRLVGSIVAGRYKVLSMLGEGGMGAVLLVEHTVIRKRMALKILNDEMMKNPEMVARFEREALAAAHIDHPNVVAATDSGRTEDGSLFVVLEYVDGQSLRDALAFGPLQVPRALHIARQAASALQRAHGLGIIHRDLKPENLMLVSRDGDENFVKILDFGLAKLSVASLIHDSGGGSGSGKSEVVTRMGAIFGTPSYMAPEQAAGGEVDGRTDLYALGIVLFEMLTGRVPFEGADHAEVLKRQLIAKVPPFSQIAPGLKIPPPVETLVNKLLEKQPDKRMQNAKEVVEAIDDVVLGDALLYDPSDPMMRMAAPGSGLPLIASGLSRAADAGNQPTRVAPAEEQAAAVALATPPKQSVISTAETMADPSGTNNPKSLALALEDLSGLSRAEAPKDGPSLGGLAERFGASSAAKQSGNQAAVSPKATAGQPATLRAPSEVQLDKIIPENAPNPAVLVPAPPPTIGERVKDAGGEAAQWVKGAVVPAVKQKTSSTWAAVRTHAPVYWNKLLAVVRGRLPENWRGVSQRNLGIAVAAVLAVPLLVVLLLVFSSDDTGSSSGAMAGYASDREMEKGVSGGPRALERLAAKYPRDSRVFRALTKSYAGKSDYASALRSLGNLLKLDPGMTSDDEMGQIVAAAALSPDTSDQALSLLENTFGEKGADVLLDLAEKTTMEPWRTRFNQTLQKAPIRQHASEATIVLLDMRAATRCEEKRTLLKRAGQVGDQRVLEYLQKLQVPTGCGASGQADCWPCLRRGGALQAAMDAIQKRGGVAPPPAAPK